MPGGADVERLTVQDQVHGRRELLLRDVRHQLPGLHIEDLHRVAGFVCHVQMLAVHDDAPHGVPGLAVLVEHHLEAQRRWYIERMVNDRTRVGSPGWTRPACRGETSRRDIA